MPSEKSPEIDARLLQELSEEDLARLAKLVRAAESIQELNECFMDRVPVFGDVFEDTLAEITVRKRAKELAALLAQYL